MEKVKKLIRGFALLGGFGMAAFMIYAVIIGPVSAIQNIEAVLSAGTYRFMLNGTPRWTLRVLSGGSLALRENSNINLAVATFDTTDGSLLLRTRTNTQLSTLAPTAANELIVNSSVPALCISSGTTAGAWVMLTSTTSASLSSVTSKQCY